MVYEATPKTGEWTKTEKVNAGSELFIYMVIFVAFILSVTEMVEPWVFLPVIGPALMMVFGSYLGIYHIYLGWNLRKDGKMSYKVTDKEIQVLFEGKVRREFLLSSITNIQVVEELKGAKAVRYGGTYYFTENTTSDDFPTVHIMATSLTNGLVFKYGYEWIYLSPEKPTYVKEELVRKNGTLINELRMEP